MFSDSSLSAPTAATAAGGRRVTDPLVVAYDHYANGNWAKAIEAYTAILDKQPGNPKAQKFLAKCYVATGKYDEAIELLEDNDEDPGITAYTGELLIDVGRYEQAEGLLVATLDIDPGNLRALHNLGRLHQLRGNKDKAERYLSRTIRRAAAIRPATYETEGFAGLASFALGYKKASGTDYFLKAKGHLSRAVMKNGRAFDFYTAFGQLFQAKDNPADARKIFSEILVKNENWADAHVGLAASLAGSGRFDKAMEHVNKALAINPNHPGAHALLAVVNLYKGDDKKAQEHLNSALAVNPAAIDLLAVQAAMHLLDDDEKQFENVEERVLAINPKPSKFYEGIARVTQNKFRFDYAIQYSRKAIQLDPENWSAYAVLGLNLMRTGEEKEARKILEAQHKGDGYNTMVYNMLELSDHLNDNFVTTVTEHFVLRVHKKEHEVITPYAADLLEEAYDRLSRKYEFIPEGPILVEVFKSHRYFAARTVGLPGLFALGACFGKVVTLDSPSVLQRRGNWGVVLWHEFAHVITVQQSNWRVPRWLTEGLSEYEQKARYAEWDREQDAAFLQSLLRDELVSVGELDDAFQGSAQRIVASYFQSSQIVEFVVDTWGFETIPAILKQFAAGKKLSEVLSKTVGISVPEFDKRFRRWALQRYAEYKVLIPFRESDIERLEAKLKNDPNDPVALIWLATAQLDARDTDKAEATARKALKNDPKNADAHVILGKVMVRNGKGTEAVAEFEAAIAGKSSDQFAPHLNLARYYDRIGNRVKAIEHYEAAVRNFPRLVDARQRPILLLRLAALYRQAGNNDAYIRSLECVAAINEKDVETRLKLAAYYRAQGNSQALIAVLRQINYIDPFAKGHHVELGDLLLAAGDARRAAIEFGVARVLGAGDADTLYVKQATAYMKLPDKKAALNTLEEALKANDKNAEAKQLLAKVKAMRDPIAVNKPQARRVLRVALERWKLYEAARTTKEYWSSTGYKPTAAEKAQIDKRLQASPDSFLEEARKAAELDPSSSSPYELMASILYHGMQYKEAVRAARKALILNSDYANGHLLLALSLRRMALQKKAKKEMDSARALLAEAISELKTWAERDPLSPHATQEFLTRKRWEQELTELK